MKKNEKNEVSRRERAMGILRSQIKHWRYLEELGAPKEIVAKKIGGLKLVLSILEE